VLCPDGDGVVSEVGTAMILFSQTVLRGFNRDRDRLSNGQ